MANKIISFESNAVPQKSRQYLYRDVSMQSQIRQVKELELTPDDKVVSVYRTRNFIDKNIDERAIKTSLYNIFSWAPGERVINPEFGSKLMKYLYNGITATNQE